MAAESKSSETILNYADVKKAYANTKLFINGEWVAPLSKAYTDVVDPATEEVIATVANANASDVDLAVRAARKAFDETNWSDLTGKERGVYLLAIAAKLTEHKTRLAALESLNSGKPIKETEWDLDDVAGCFTYYAGQAEELDKRQNSALALPHASFKGEMRYEAMGVAGCIIPWNYPLLMLAWKVAPALAAGCTVVLKPSELTPLTALEFAKLVQEVKLPAGVFNLVTGLGPSAGEPLVVHKAVDKIAFTGSVPTGARIGMSCAKDIRNATLELGGKSAIIVFDDVDIDKAVEWIMFGCFWTNGQICSATSRLLVADKIAPKLMARLVEETRRIPLVNPNLTENKDKTGVMGPLVSKAQWQKVKGMVTASIADGGKLLAGGTTPATFTKGFFLEPTIIEVSKLTNLIWTDEVFGPVLAVHVFNGDEREAIRLANDTDFGLAGAVLSNDTARCARVARKLRAGITWINCSQPCFVEAPWGGLKKSGVGRELGPWGLNNYLEPKQITSYISSDPWGWYIKTPASKL